MATATKPMKRTKRSLTSKGDQKVMAPSATPTRTQATKAPYVPPLTARPSTSLGKESIVSTISSGKMERLLVGELFTDPSYNRPLTVKKVEKIVREFNPDALGVIEVSQRANGRNIILDGQNRIAALRVMNYHDQRVDCHVMTGLSIEDETVIFKILNVDRTRLSPQDIFRAELRGGDKAAIAIRDTVALRGVDLATNSKDTTGIRAISVLKRLYEVGGPMLIANVIDAIKDSWEAEEHQRWDAQLMLGLAHVFVEWPQLNHDQLVTGLRRSLPSTIINKARVARTSGWRLSGGIGTIIVDLYNARLGERRRLSTVSPGYLANSFHRTMTAKGVIERKREGKGFSLP